jgi:hypothetical protein
MAAETIERNRLVRTRMKGHPWQRRGRERGLRGAVRFWASGWPCGRLSGLPRFCPKGEHLRPLNSGLRAANPGQRAAYVAEERFFDWRNPRPVPQGVHRQFLQVFTWVFAGAEIVPTRSPLRRPASESKRQGGFSSPAIPAREL